MPSRAVCRFEISTSSDWISSRETSLSDDIGQAALRGVQRSWSVRQDLDVSSGSGTKHAFRVQKHAFRSQKHESWPARNLKRELAFGKSLGFQYNPSWETRASSPNPRPNQRRRISTSVVRPAPKTPAIHCALITSATAELPRSAERAARQCRERASLHPRSHPAERQFATPRGAYPAYAMVAVCSSCCSPCCFSAVSVTPICWMSAGSL